MSVLFVITGEGCAGKSVIALEAWRALRLAHHRVTIVRKETTRPQRTDIARAAMDAAFYDFVKPSRMRDVSQFVSLTHGIEGVYGIRRKKLDDVLERGNGIIVHHPSGIDDLRAVCDVRVVHIVPQDRSDALDTRSDRRRAFDAQEFATVPPADLVVYNSFIDDGLALSVEALTRYIARH